MRENIGLYRGKRTDNGEWIYGSLLKIDIDGSTAWVIFGSEFQRDGSDVISKVHAHVDPDTVGECIHIPDKNEKLIFEDDIVRHYNKIGVGDPKTFDTGVIYWRKRSFSWARTTRQETDWDWIRIGEDCVYEIIGNIHDNPELLGGAGE